jgi:YVTN family beta-propeller protein
MEFLVLGSLEVVSDGRSLPLGGAKQRAVLAVLVLNANRVVSTDQLIDALWGERAPEGAPHTLQVYVSQLRKSLRVPGSPAPDTILVTQGRGYLLRVESEAIDLHRFERMAAEGRRALAAGEPDRAAERLREALGLWRGPALAELAYEAFAQPEIARIDDLRLSAVEDRIEADLAMGRHAELVGELQGLVDKHPLRERLRSHLMLALYRSGRQAEALQTYRDFRQTLSEELGIDPTPSLQNLERAILQQDPGLDQLKVHPAAPAEPGVVKPSPQRSRRTVLIGAGAAILVLVMVASAVKLASSGSGAPHPSSVPADSVGRIDAATDELVAAIPTTGTAPSAVVWADGSLWVANTISRTVARIDPGTNSVIQTVPTDGAPTDLAAGEGLVWILSGFGGTVLAIDPRTNEASSSTRVPVGSGGIAVGAEAVWVTNGLDATVTKIDPETREVAGTIRLGESGVVSPRAIAVDDDRLWVGDDLDPILYRVDAGTGEVTATVGLRADATEIAVAADGTVWATSYDADLVSVVDSNLQATTVDVGRGPTGLAVGEPWVWVANSGSGTVSRIDAGAERVVATVRIGPIPEGVAVGAGSVWVSVHA